MAKWQMISVSETMSVQDVITMIEKNSSQVALVVDSDNRLAGTVTDGDVRRALLRGRDLKAQASEIMNPNPITLPDGVSDQLILSVMQQKQIRDIPLVDHSGRVTRVVSLSEFLHTRTKDNWVVIMAGGLGSRLMPLTEDKPKPMLQIGDRPILLRIIESLVAAGFSRYFISVNYRAEVIESFFGDGSRFGIQIEYLREKERLGTAGALGLLPEVPKSPLIVMNGDVLTQLQFDSLLRFHDESRAMATVCATTHEVQVPFGVIESSADRVTAIREKPLCRWLVNAGVYVIDPGCLSLIPKGAPYDMTTLLQTLIASEQNVASFPMHEYWIDIGRHDDLHRARSDSDLAGTDRGPGHSA